VLTLSGNNASIRVDGGYLIVSDGPWPVPPEQVGLAAPVEQRMATHRFRRADCPINRIIVTRADGFITFAAIKCGCTASEWVSCNSTGTVRSFWRVSRPTPIKRLYAVPKRWRPGTALVTALRKSSSAPNSMDKLPLLACSTVAR
jgi:hypothetical protein